jgi:hypothetical protein
VQGGGRGALGHHGGSAPFRGVQGQGAPVPAWAGCKRVATTAPSCPAAPSQIDVFEFMLVFVVIQLLSPERAQHLPHEIQKTLEIVEAGGGRPAAVPGGWRAAQRTVVPRPALAVCPLAALPQPLRRCLACQPAPLVDRDLPLTPCMPAPPPPAPLPARRTRSAASTRLRTATSSPPRSPRCCAPPTRPAARRARCRTSCSPS